jgi:hypothetical protein
MNGLIDGLKSLWEEVTVFRRLGTSHMISAS